MLDDLGRTEGSGVHVYPWQTPIPSPMRSRFHILPMPPRTSAIRSQGVRSSAMQMGPKEMKAYCAPSDAVKALLRAAIQQLGLSARAYDRLLRVSRTIADLSESEEIQAAHVAEAIQYRSLDRKLWGT